MEEKQQWTYCVAGNIKKMHFDDNGTLRYGTHEFTGGTKVYLSGRLWDRTCDHINVLGRNRGKKLQVVWTDISLVENVRCQKVFNSAVLEIMNNFEFCAGWWGKSKKEKADAEAFVQWWNRKLRPIDENTVVPDLS